MEGKITLETGVLDQWDANRVCASWCPVLFKEH